MRYIIEMMKKQPLPGHVKFSKSSNVSLKTKLIKLEFLRKKQIIHFGKYFCFQLSSYEKVACVTYILHHIYGAHF